MSIHFDASRDASAFRNGIVSIGASVAAALAPVLADAFTRAF